MTTVGPIVLAHASGVRMPDNGVAHLVSTIQEGVNYSRSRSLLPVARTVASLGRLPLAALHQGLVSTGINAPNPALTTGHAGPGARYFATTQQAPSLYGSGSEGDLALQSGEFLLGRGNYTEVTADRPVRYRINGQWYEFEHFEDIPEGDIDRDKFYWITPDHPYALIPIDAEQDICLLPGRQNFGMPPTDVTTDQPG